MIEQTLSDMINEGNPKYNDYILVEEIEDFIKKLKEELPKATICTYSENIYKIHEIIDKLSVSKLTVADLQDNKQ